MSSRCITTFKCWLAIVAASSFAGETIKDADVIALARGDHTEFSLITAHGWVRFIVGENWKVLQLDTKKSIKLALFQIPDPADEGTEDSTNASVMLDELESPEASAGYARVRQKYAKGTKSRIGGWEVFQSDFKQKDTTYSGLVAFRDVADVHVTVVFAWPHLLKNAADYDSEMEQTFHGLLNSLRGELGKYPTRNGEVLRRPE